MSRALRRLAFTSIVVLAAVLWLAVPVHAQDGPISRFHVRSVPEGVKFKVDGLAYRDQATFLWPKGSRHVIEFMIEGDGFQYDDSRTSRFAFRNWADANSLSATASGLIHTVTADTGVSGLVLNAQVQHQVLLHFREGYPAPAAMSPGNCGAPGPGLPKELRTGVVYIDGACYRNSGTLWMAAGTHSLDAFPAPGFVFLGWEADVGPSAAYLREFGIQIHGPFTLVPRFTAADVPTARPSVFTTHTLTRSRSFPRVPQPKVR